MDNREVALRLTEKAMENGYIPIGKDTEKTSNSLEKLMDIHPKIIVRFYLKILELLQANNE